MTAISQGLPVTQRRVVTPLLRLGRHVQHVTAVELVEDARQPVLDAYLTATRRRTTRQLLAGAGTRTQDHPVFQLRSNP